MDGWMRFLHKLIVYGYHKLKFLFYCITSALHSDAEGYFKLAASKSPDVCVYVCVLVTPSAHEIQIYHNLEEVKHLLKINN